MSHVWTEADLDLLQRELAETREQISDTLAAQAVSPEADAQRQDTICRMRRELARLEKLQAEANHR